MAPCGEIQNRSRKDAKPLRIAKFAFVLSVNTSVPSVVHAYLRNSRQSPQTRFCSLKIQR